MVIVIKVIGKKASFMDGEITLHLMIINIQEYGKIII